jgi:hypothetical protein
MTIVFASRLHWEKQFIDNPLRVLSHQSVFLTPAISTHFTVALVAKSEKNRRASFRQAARSIR